LLTRDRLDPTAAERMTFRGQDEQMRHGAGSRDPYDDGRGPGWQRRGGSRRRQAWRAKTRLARAGYIVATLVAVVAVIGGVGGYAEVRHLEGNITVVKVSGLSGRTVYGAQNILVLGSQTRQGQVHGAGHFGVAAGDSPLTSNSDNLLLIHLDPTHTHALVLSIPRDTFVYEPACEARNSYIGIGMQAAAAYPPGAIIDGALNIGGPTCAVDTVEDLTGVKLDHFVEFDFNSFRSMVDALGGVEVCVPHGGYHDTASGLNLSQGIHLVKYNTALEYVRTRDDLGGTDPGGDLPRIELQQAFISSAMQKVESENLLGNSFKLLNVANTATKALTVDPSLGSVTSLLHLADSLVHLKSKNVTMITMPTTTDTYPGLQEHLMAVEPQDDVLFDMVLTGQVWAGHLPTLPYGQVQVRVENGTGERGLAARTRAKLRKLGFDVVSVGDAPYTATTTVTYSGIAQSEDAYTVMTALDKFPAGENLLNEPTPQLGTSGPVTLILGADFAGVSHPVTVKARTLKKGKGGKKGTTATADQSVIAASAVASASGAGAVQSRNGGASICSGLPPALGGT
jgi:LCP family protein required for cell wall assembly